MKYFFILALLFATQLTHAETSAPVQSSDAHENAYLFAEQAYDAATNHVWSLAISNYINALKLAPTNENLLYSLGHTYVSVGDNKRAVICLDKAVSLNPRDVAAYDQRGIAYAGLGNYAVSLDSFATAIQLSPTNARVYFNRGVVFTKMGNYPAAITNFTHTLQVFPDATLVQFRRADLFTKLGQWQNEENDYRQILKYKPQDVLALNNLAWALATCPNARYRNGKEAIDLATKACDLTQGKQWNLLATLAAAYAEANKFDEAVKAQQKSLNANPPSGAILHLQQGMQLYTSHKPYREADPETFRAK